MLHAQTKPNHDTQVGPFSFKVVGRYEREREKIVNFKTLPLGDALLLEPFLATFLFHCVSFFYGKVLDSLRDSLQAGFPPQPLAHLKRTDDFITIQAQLYWQQGPNSEVEEFLVAAFASSAPGFVGSAAGGSAGTSSKVTLLCFTWCFFISAVTLSTLPRWQNKFNTCSVGLTCKMSRGLGSSIST